jgi:hypothetical protein
MAIAAPTDLRAEFPTLDREGMVYLDAAATSQTPRAVLAAMDDYYAHHRASVHRGVYAAAAEATDLFEGARHRIARFAGAEARNTVFTRNATEALNLVARGTAGPGDKVVLTEMEHHSNLVPWQMTGAELLWVGLDAEGRLDLDQLDGFLAVGRRQGRRLHPRLQRRGHDQPGARDLRPARGPRARCRSSTAPRPSRRRPWTSSGSAATSTPGRATRPTGRRASACSTGAARCSRRFRRCSAAGT